MGTIFAVHNATVTSQQNTRQTSLMYIAIERLATTNRAKQRDFSVVVSLRLESLIICVSFCTCWLLRKLDKNMSTGDFRMIFADDDDVFVWVSTVCMTRVHFNMYLHRNDRISLTIDLVHHEHKLACWSIGRSNDFARLCCWFFCFGHNTCQANSQIYKL